MAENAQSAQENAESILALAEHNGLIRHVEMPPDSTAVARWEALTPAEQVGLLYWKRGARRDVVQVALKMAGTDWKTERITNTADNRARARRNLGF